MSLTPTEEAQTRQLIAQEAPLLTLAASEATIISKLGATKVNLSQLPAATTVADADLLLIRQGTTDKGVGAAAFKTYAAAAASSETVVGVVRLATDAETQAGALRTVAVDPAGLKATQFYHGQCRLAKSGANLVLSPYNGNRLVINGGMQSVPSAGVSLAPPATTLTLYYIYAYMNAGVMTLESSATGHSTDTTTGIEIKTGDSTRTLVGMARTVTNAWVDTATQRFVVSWFNRHPIVVSATFSSSRSTSSTTPTELNAEIQNQFLTWGDELAEMQFNGVVTSSGAPGQTSLTNIGFDSTTAGAPVAAQYQRDTNSNTGNAQVNFWASVAEGYHYSTVIGYVSASSASWASSNLLTTKIKG